MITDKGGAFICVKWERAAGRVYSRGFAQLAQARPRYQLL